MNKEFSEAGISQREPENLPGDDKLLKRPIVIPEVPRDFVGFNDDFIPADDFESAYWITKDSGERQEFESGMVRDTTTGKVEWHRIADGPMMKRWAELLTRGGVKYQDVSPGVANWTLANGEAEYQRFKQSAFRHFMTWYAGETDEDHAAAVYFNINGAEYTKAKLEANHVAS